MSYWTEFRDSTLKSLGIDSGAAASKTAGNLSAQQIAQGARGGAAQETLQPSAGASIVARSSSVSDTINSLYANQKWLVIGAVIGLVYLISKKRR